MSSPNNRLFLFLLICIVSPSLWASAFVLQPLPQSRSSFCSPARTMTPPPNLLSSPSTSGGLLQQPGTAVLIQQQQRSSAMRAALMRREVIPQLLFAATCAGAIIGYVATHIDEIKEKQKVAVERTMNEQANNIKSAQDAQKEAINQALKKQEEALRKIKEQQQRR